MSEIKAINFTENKVGKRIKASKKKYSWRLLINNREYSLDLFVSKLSGKLKVVVNNDIVHTGKRTKSVAFQYSSDFSGHQIHLIQQGKQFDLRIDSVAFDYLLMQNKTKEEFKYEFKPREMEPEEESLEETPPPPPVKSVNPFDDMFDEQKEPPKPPVQVENQPKKLKPFSVKPPPPPPSVTYPKPVGIFQAPEIMPTKTTLAEDLFENPSKPSKPVFAAPSFPQVENPFFTGNLVSQPKPQPQYYTGNSNYYK